MDEEVHLGGAAARGDGRRERLRQEVVAFRPGCRLRARHDDGVLLLVVRDRALCQGPPGGVEGAAEAPLVGVAGGPQGLGVPEGEQQRVPSWVQPAYRGGGLRRSQARAEQREPDGRRGDRVRHVGRQRVGVAGVHGLVECGGEVAARPAADGDEVAGVEDVDPCADPVGREAVGLVDATVMRPQDRDAHGRSDRDEQVDAQAGRQSAQQVDHDDRAEAVRDDDDTVGGGQLREDLAPRRVPVPARVGVLGHRVHRRRDGVRHLGVAEHPRIGPAGLVARRCQRAGQHVGSHEVVVPPLMPLLRPGRLPGDRGLVAGVPREQRVEVLDGDDAIRRCRQARVVLGGESGVERVEPACGILRTALAVHEDDRPAVCHGPTVPTSPLRVLEQCQTPRRGWATSER